MYEYFEAEKAKKKAMTTEEKKAAKKAKEEAEAQYMSCLLNGRKEKVGNFRVEPPGLFRGRGDHPKKGALKVSALVIRLLKEPLTRNSFESVPRTSPSTLARMRLFLFLTWLGLGRLFRTTIL